MVRKSRKRVSRKRVSRKRISRKRSRKSFNKKRRDRKKKYNLFHSPGINVHQEFKIKNSVEKMILPKGSKLYRTQPVKCSTLKPIHDKSDTGKTGVYFSDGIYIPLGMILEYNKPMYLCEYKTTGDIEFFLDKYSFRSLEPKHFFKTYDDYVKSKFILYKDPLKNYNHIDMSLLPIADIFYNPIWENLDEKEYFIKPEDIHKLRVISNSTEQFSVREANIILHKQMTMMKDVGRF